MSRASEGSHPSEALVRRPPTLSQAQEHPVSILLSPAPTSKPITVAPASPDPFYVDRPVYAVEVSALIFGVRVRHRVTPGVWKVVRAASRLDITSRYHVRVREQADNGSLFGPVLNWRLDEVAALVTDA